MAWFGFNTDGNFLLDRSRPRKLASIVARAGTA
jgi:hypothetical protein